MITRFKKFARRILGKKRPSLRWMKFGPHIDKIKGAVELQRICQAFSIPFEQIKVYYPGSRILPTDIGGTERIIVRGPVGRSEYVVKNVSAERLKEICQEIETRTSNWASLGVSKFIVQKVGLRESIERYGNIYLMRKLSGFAGKISYGESLYNPLERNSQDVFIAPSKTPFELEAGKLSANARKFFNKKLGNRNAHEMMECIFSRLEAGGEARLRFVRYKDKKQCFFYDMLIS